MQTKTAIRITLGCVVLALAAAPLAAQTNGSAYDQLDPDELARKLRSMNMTVLLDSLVEQTTSGAAATPKQMRLLAESKLATYQNDPQGPAGQEALQAAIRIYRDLIERFERSAPSKTDPDKGEAWMQHGENLLRLAKIYSWTLARPHADRVLRLYAGQADYARLKEYTAEADKILIRLRNLLEDINLEWNSEPVMVVLYTSELSHLEAQYRLSNAWARLFQALAIQPYSADPRQEARRSSYLDQAAFSIEQFKKKSLSRYPNSRGKCNLILGMVRREQGMFEEAVGLLSQAADEKTDQSVKFQAAFEMAKAQVEKGIAALRRGEQLIRNGMTSQGRAKLTEATGIFENAQRPIEDFEQSAYRLDDKVVQDGVVDVFVTLLNVHRLEAWAQALKDQPQRADDLRKRAQQLLVEFFNKHRGQKDLLLFFSNVLAQKFEGTENLEDLNSMILYALALRRFNQADAEGTEKAREMIAIILDRTDDLSSDLHPKVLWLSANIALGQDQPLKAAELAAQVGRRFEQSEEAFTATEWACKIYSQALEKDPSLEVRRKAVEVLELLLEKGPSQWRQKAPQWWFELGWHREKLADTSRGAQKQALLDQAVEAYKRVPQDRLESLQAGNRLLRIRVTRLEDRIARAREDNPQAPLGREIQQEARELSDELQTYEQSIPSRLDDVEDAPLKQALRSWAASAAFHALRLRYEVLDSKDSLARIAELGSKWPDTPILPVASGYYTEKLITEDRIDDAVAAIEQYEQQYGPESSRSLMIKLMNKIRETIVQMEYSPGQDERLKRYRQTYYVFAQKLFDQAGSDQTPPERLYRLEQILASALYEVGRLDESLEHFQALRKREETQHALQAKIIAQRFDREIREIRDAAGRLSIIKDLLKDFMAKAPREYPDATRTVDYVQLDSLISDLQTADAADAARISRQAAQKLIELLETLKKAKMEKQREDPINLLGIARIYAAKREFDKAEPLYGRLARGLTQRAENLYYTVWLEYGHLILEAYADDAKRLENLQLRLERMRREGGDMAGMRPQFDQLIGRIERLGQ